MEGRTQGSPAVLLPMALEVENTIAFQENQDLMETKGEKETTMKMMMVWGPQARCCGGGTCGERWDGDRSRRQASGA